ncbi:NAD(P)/FAD-dependent oxidoreductase [Hyalangium sp.]|uniref:NAD(P)/FAD-dependent oxidoreductase n=1 Tax=Hyalangium sp. TaxID=2028555 RepID=UPI002D52E778|nr:NAD(P)/FAD-dependent oxidoreductase [Hyalangium sp.]HYI02257.1 NAD(P)/FAD-dependent oxidoreductase [Hyalangium sp.]
MPKMYDVAIVGAGPAGVSTALFLIHRRPELAGRIIVLEKATFPRDKFCGGAMGARADAWLSEIGVHVDVPSVMIDGISLALTGGTVQRRMGRIGRVVRRMEFDHALVRVLIARGVQLIEGARVTALTPGTDAVHLDTSAGAFLAKAVVGADGVGSVVRRSLGLPFGDLLAQVAEVDTEPVPGDPPRDVLHFDASNRSLVGYSWDFPTLVDGKALVCRGVYVLGIGRMPGADATQLLAERLEERGLHLSDYRVKRFSERGFEVHRPFAAHRILLVGEAAGIDPLVGEGIGQAIEYGKLAGDYLAARLGGRELRFDDWTKHVALSALGLHLSARGVLVSGFYGRPRPTVERLLLTVPGVTQLLMSLFAGRSITLGTLARVAGESGLRLAGQVRGALARR